MIDSILSIRQICELAGIASSTPNRRTRTKDMAITKLSVALYNLHPETADEVQKMILSSADCKTALDVLKAHMMKLNEERGQPNNRLEATTINGMGQELIPSLRERENRMDDQSNATGETTANTEATGEGTTTPAPKKERVARVSKFAGKQLTATLAPKPDTGEITNPRKVDSHGYRSMKIIMENPGIYYEEFIKAGGRLNDLDWDVTKGHVKAE